MRNTALICAFILVCAASGCDKFSRGVSNGISTPPPLTNSAEGKIIFVLFDISDSAAATETRQKYAESFKRVLSSTGAGDVVVADTITDNPLSQSFFPVNISFAPFNPGTDNDLLIKKRKQEHDRILQGQRDEAIRAADTLLNDTGRTIKQTNILDAMLLADRVFHSYLRPKKVLVVFSDMIEESGRYNFQRQKLDDAQIEHIISNEKKAQRLPDLSGVKVYVVGANAKPASDQFLNIQKFWLRYFQAAGADLPKERYGAALLNFDE